MVIGERGRRIPLERALEHVAGYAVANDVSMRDYQYKTPPVAPGQGVGCLDPGRPRPRDARSRSPSRSPSARSSTARRSRTPPTELLIFDVATLVSTVSEFADVEPGDLILTGTPGGVGYRREPQLLLKDGDVVVVEVDGVGRIENRCVAERPV